MTIDTVFGFVLGFVVMVSWILLSWLEPDAVGGLIAELPAGLTFPVTFYPISRTLWTTVDIAMRPMGPNEVRT